MSDFYYPTLLTAQSQSLINQLLPFKVMDFTIIADVYVY